MSTNQQPLLPPGTRENAVATRSWRLTAWIAGLFTLLVGVGMIAAQLRHKSSDPWRSPTLLKLKAQLLTQPKNEQLKQEIRAMDLGLRERYFRLLSFKATGVYLMFGGALVFLYAGNRVRLLQKRLPMPQPDPDAGLRLARRARLSRNAVVACSVVALAAFSVIALTESRSPLNDQEMMAALLGQQQSTPAPAYAVTTEELRANWPRFRGYDGAGFDGEESTLHSAPSVIWKTPSPAPGYNSPLIWKEKLFFTGGGAKLREVLCLNALSGELVWRQSVNVPGPPATEDAPEIPEMTGYAAATAATDGERVYAMFATGEVIALTLDGLLVWSKNIGPIDNPYGHAASLAIWQDRLIAQVDQGDEESRKSKVICWDGATGEILWQKSRPVGASWTSPIVVEASGKAQLLTLSLPWAISYSPEDGTELWRAGPLDGEVTPSPVFANGRFIVVNPGTYQLMAIRPDGSGDVSKTHIEWTVDGDMPDITSPVSNGELIFTVTSDGTLSCFASDSGELIWKESIEAGGEFQASPSIMGNTLLLLSAAGDVIALEAGRTYQELWRMPLENEFYASPAFANGKVFLRGNKSVWCLGELEAMTKSNAP